MLAGPSPAEISSGLPVVSFITRLFVVPSITETEPKSALTTQAMLVFGFTATLAGCSPLRLSTS